MPISLELSHKLLMVLAEIRREGLVMTYLRPDAKSQVTVEYNELHKPVNLKIIVVSTQHDEFSPSDEEMQQRIRQDIIDILIPRVIASVSGQMQIMLSTFLKVLLTGDSSQKSQVILHVNPTGRFVIGGPHGDTGLTGRKIIVDTYGGKGAHGGGAFSGKDPSKVDRSAAYAARHIAKNLVAAGVSDEILVQLAYAIGVADPLSIFVNTYGKSRVSTTDAEIAEKIGAFYDFRPKAIERRLRLRNPIYSETAAYGHMGRNPETITKTINSISQGTREFTVELFTWEKLDMVDDLKQIFFS